MYLNHHVFRHYNYNSFKNKDNCSTRLLRKTQQFDVKLFVRRKRQFHLSFISPRKYIHIRKRSVAKMFLPNATS